MSDKYLTFKIGKFRTVEFYKYDDGDIEIDIDSDKTILTKEQVNEFIDWIQDNNSKCPECGSELIPVYIYC